jgi:hypothetical protein
VQIRKWTIAQRIGATVVGMATVGATVIAVLVYRDEPEPPVQLLRACLVASKEVKVERFEYVGAAPTIEQYSTMALDLVLRNNGELSAYINRAEILFRRASYPGSCTTLGGEVYYSAAYSVVAPTEEVAPPQATTVTKDLNFEVQGGRVERLALVIGPDDFGDEGWPWLYDVEVRLFEQSGAQVSGEIPRFIVVEPATFIPVSEWLTKEGARPEAQNCIENMRHEVNEFFAVPEGVIISPKLQDLQKLLDDPHESNQNMGT